MKKLQIASLRHRVKLCSQKDVVNADGDLQLNREGVLSMWASIEEKAASAFSNRGAELTKSGEKRTHIVMTRYHHSFDVSNLAWLYEERMKSSPRWFKILRVGQTEHKGSQMFKFECRLMERSDSAVKPIEPLNELSPALGLPEGVKL